MDGFRNQCCHEYQNSILYESLIITNDNFRYDVILKQRILEIGNWKSRFCFSYKIIQLMVFIFEIYNK